jgi:hypothetical protein
LALQHLGLHDGEVVYTRGANVSSLVLTHADASLAYTADEGITASVSAALGSSGEIGKVALQAFTPKWETSADPGQVEWQGEVHLSGLLVHLLGRTLGAEWPQATLDLRGRYQGQWVGPIELTGEMRVGNARVGNVRVSKGKARLTKLLWPGQAGVSLLSAFPSILRALVVEAQIEEVQGEIGESKLLVMLHTGNLTLRDEELAATGITGTYGTKSQITEGGGTLKRLFSRKGPGLDLRLVADLDLEEGLGSILAAPTGTGPPFFSQYLTQPRGVLSCSSASERQNYVGLSRTTER